MIRRSSEWPSILHLSRFLLSPGMSVLQGFFAGRRYLLVLKSPVAWRLFCFS
jgi:hypothetical protein